MTAKKPLQLDHVSYSSLKIWRECPHHFWFRYLQDAIKPAARLSQSIGGIWHEWQESYAAICKDLEVPVALSEGRQLARTYGEEVLALAESFMASYRYDWQWRENTTEMNFRVPLPDDLPDFVGRIDCLEYLPHDDRLRVTDYKAFWLGKQAEEPPPQLRWYAWAAQEARLEATGKAVGDIEVCLWSVPTGEAQTWRLPFGPQSDARDEIVLLTRDALAATEYRATPSEKACAWCAYKADCEAAQNVVFSAPQDAQEAAELMGKAEAHRAATKDLTGLVQAWVREHGSVECGGKLYDYQLPVWYADGKHRYDAKDAEKLFTAMKRAGLKPWDFLAFDARRLGNAFHEIVEAGEPDLDAPFGDAEPEALAEVVKLLVPVVPTRAWRGQVVKPETEEEEADDEADTDGRAGRAGGAGGRG